MTAQDRQEPSWTMRNRLGLTRQEQLAGAPYNPHHVCYAVRVTGALDLDRLSQAWLRIQQRHPALCTRFDLADGSWLTVPVPPAELTTSCLPAADRALARAEAELAAELRRPFDLSRGPLARLHVVPVTDSLSVAGFAVEHLVTDGWSRAVLISELWRLYRSPAISLPPIPLDFPAWVRRQASWLRSSAGVAELRQRVMDLLPVGPVPEIRLPGIKLPPRGFSQAESGSVAFSLDQETVAALRVTGAPHALSPVGLVHAALAAAVHELTGVPWVGTMLAVANRADPETHNIVGWLSDNVLVVSEFRKQASDSAFLEEFSEYLAKAFDAAHLPLAAVLEAWQPGLAGMPSERPWVAFNPIPANVARRFPADDLAGLTLEEFGVPGGWHYKTLQVVAEETAEGISAEITYKIRWYQAETAELLREVMLGKLARWSGRKEFSDGSRDGNGRPGGSPGSTPQDLVRSTRSR